MLCLCLTLMAGMWCVARSDKLCPILENSPRDTVACSFELGPDVTAVSFHLIAASSKSFRFVQAGDTRVDLVSRDRLDREQLAAEGQCQRPGAEFNLHEKALLEACWMPGRLSVASRQQNVWLVVMDVNDNAPRFHRDKFSIDTPEEQDPSASTSDDQLIGLPTATDLDVGENGTVRYELQGHEGLFELRQSLGVPKLRILAKLDRERCLGYKLQLVAKDSGDLTASLHLVVRVTDVNDHDPRIRLPKDNLVSVHEGQRPGQPIVRLALEDADRLAHLATPRSPAIGQTHCDFPPAVTSFAGLYPDSRPFSIASGNSELRLDSSLDVGLLQLFDLSADGVLSAKRVLDFERLRSKFRDADELGYLDFVLPIVAHDDGKPSRSTTATLTVRLHDENDNDPIISIQRLVQPQEANGIATFDDLNSGGPLYVTENAADGSHIALIMVSDMDSGSHGTVNCSVSDSPTAFGSVLRHPMASPSSPSSLPLSSESSFFELMHDSSLNKMKTFILVKKGANLDREVRPVMHVKLMCFDGDNMKPRTTVRILSIALLDENDNGPVFPSHLPVFSLMENVAGPEHALGEMKAVDADHGRNQRVFYHIPGGNASHVFRVDPLSGVVYVQEPVDYEKVKEFQFPVSAFDLTELEELSQIDHASADQDSSLQSLLAVVERVELGSTILKLQVARATFRVKVVDANDNAPIFDEPLNFEVREGEAHWIGRLTARDADEGRNAKFHFASILPDDFSPQQCAGHGGQQPLLEVCLWRVLGDGNIHLAQRFQLDRETRELYQIPVMVVDEGQPALTSTATVEIRVLDANDNKPRFIVPNSSFSGIGGARENRLNISVDTPDDTVICKLRAEDPDAGQNAEITYILQSQSIYALNSETIKRMNITFSLDPVTGELKLHRSMGFPRDAGRHDRMIQMSFRLTLAAKDNGTPSRMEYAHLFVDLIDNEYKPPVGLEERPGGSGTHALKAKEHSDGLFDGLLNGDGSFLTRDVILGLTASLVVLVILACVALFFVVLMTNRKHPRQRQNRSQLPSGACAAFPTSSLGNTVHLSTADSMPYFTYGRPTQLGSKEEPENSRLRLPLWLRGKRKAARPRTQLQPVHPQMTNNNLRAPADENLKAYELIFSGHGEEQTPRGLAKYVRSDEPGASEAEHVLMYPAEDYMMLHSPNAHQLAPDPTVHAKGDPDAYKSATLSSRSQAFLAMQLSEHV